MVIDNDDNLCLARAICVGISRHEDAEDVYASMRKGRKIQQTRAIALFKKAGVSLNNRGGIKEVRQFQNHLDLYQITVFRDRKGREVLYEGPTSSALDGRLRKEINLIYGENHFNVIASIVGAFNCSYYCRPCRMPFNMLLLFLNN